MLLDKMVALLKQKWMTAALVAAVVFMALLTRNGRAETDPRYSLLVAEAILTEGTIRLDHVGKDNLAKLGYVIHQKNGHFYHIFPMGTPILSLPFVAVTYGLGFRVLDYDPYIQRLITALSGAIMLLVMLRLARRLVDERSALIVVALFFLGSSFSSTLMTALWSHNGAVLCALLAMDGILAGPGKQWRNWPIIALCMFLAYFCRPTMLLMIPFALLLIANYSLRAASLTFFGVSVLGAVFVAFSYWEFGQPLPDYYMPQRLEGGDIALALWGNVLSPARGLLVYSPFLLAAWLGRRNTQHAWPLKPGWWWLGLGWPLAHLVAISSFPHWWGGHTYGPRLMSDALPGLLLLTLRSGAGMTYASLYPVGRVIFAVAVIWSIFANSVQGLLNRSTKMWFGSPDIDRNPHYLFDWSDPPFFATAGRLQKRMVRHHCLEENRLKSSGPKADCNSASASGAR